MAQLFTVRVAGDLRGIGHSTPDDIAFASGLTAEDDGQGGFFTWDTASAADDSVDRFNPPSGGTAAGWKRAQALRMFMHPASGTDDSAGILAAGLAAAGSGRELILPDPLYLLANPVLLTPEYSFLTLRLGNGTRLKSTMTPNGFSKSHFFYVNPQLAAVQTTTLAGGNTAGTRTVSSAASIPNGSTIYILNSVSNGGGSTMGVVRKVVSHSGGGPYSLTLDREIDHTFGAGDVLYVLKSVYARGTSPPTCSAVGLDIDDVSARVELTSAGADGAAQYRVVVNGTQTATGTVPAGGGTITLGATNISFTFAAGTYAADNVYRVCARVSNFRIFGGVITGAADRGVEIVAAYRCSLEDLVIDDSEGGLPQDAGSSWDIASSECTRRNVTVSGATSAGLLHESAERCVDIACRATKTTGCGFGFWNAVHPQLVACSGDDNEGNGLVSSTDGDGEGVIGGTVLGGSFRGNTSSNVDLSNTTGLRFFGTDLRFSKNVGGANALVAATCSDVAFHGANLSGGANVGLNNDGARTYVSADTLLDSNANGPFAGGVAPSFAQRGEDRVITTLTGTKTLTFKEALSTVIETSGILTGDLIVEVPVTPGLVYQLYNGNTAAHTTTFRCAGGDGGFALPQGQRALAYIAAAGNLIQMPRPLDFKTATLAAGAQVVDMTGCDRLFATGDAGGTSSITNFTATDGQKVTLVNVGAPNVTFTRANAVLRASADKVLPQFGTLTVILKGGLWYELDDQLTNG